MAAWLAYLKSRLLLPEDAPGEGPSAEDMAPALANRLRRLEAIREAADRLMDRPQLGRDMFPRGNARADRRDQAAGMDGDAVRSAVGLCRAAPAHACWRACSFKKRTVWSLAEARAALERLIGQSSDWSRIDQFLISYVVEPSQAATVFASTFAAALELVREGVAEIHQKDAFAPIYLRKRVGRERQSAWT